MTGNGKKKNEEKGPRKKVVYSSRLIGKLSPRTLRVILLRYTRALVEKKRVVFFNSWSFLNQEMTAAAIVARRVVMRNFFELTHPHTHTHTHTHPLISTCICDYKIAVYPPDHSFRDAELDGTNEFVVHTHPS